MMEAFLKTQFCLVKRSSFRCMQLIGVIQKIQETPSLTLFASMLLTEFTMQRMTFQSSKIFQNHLEEMANFTKSQQLKAVVSNVSLHRS